MKAHEKRLFIWLLCLTWLLAGLSSMASAQCSDLETAHSAFKWSGTEPLVLLTEYNPWAMSIGSDTPTLALYVDGTVIYWQGDRRSGKYVTAHLSEDQVSQWFDATRLDKLDKLKDCYSIEDGTDAPTNVLVIKTHEGFKSLEVYGMIRHMENVADTKLPVDLRTALEKILAYTAKDVTPWQPRYFEVVIWPFTYAKSSAPWPSSFSKISDQKTRPTRSGYRLFLPISQLNQYKEFVAKMKPTQAVLIDGRKWAVSARFPFPHEGP